MFKRLFGAPPKAPDTKVRDVLDMSLQFVKFSLGALPDDFEQMLSADTFYILVGFQAGALIQAAYVVGISPEATGQLIPVLLEQANNMSAEKSKLVAKKIGALVESGYPPVDNGAEALDAFYSAENEQARVEAAQRLSVLIQNFEARRGQDGT